MPTLALVSTCAPARRRCWHVDPPRLATAATLAPVNASMRNLFNRLGLAWRNRAAWVVMAGFAALATATAQPLGNAASWAQLSPAQKEVLAPLQPDWAQIEPPRQQKWLELANRYPKLPASEQQRIRTRMADWSRLSPADRGRARLQFQEAQGVPTEQRQAKWQEYQALSGEQKQALNQQAKPGPTKVGAKAAIGTPAAANTATAGAMALPASATAAVTPAGASGAAAAPSSGSSTAKRNLVQAQATPRPKAVSTTAVQAKPGATTSSINARTGPPAHHQPGLPKISATPGFVDPTTLLPQRGPQGAAVQAVAPTAPSQP
jgi:hypothetical protein